MKHINTIMAIVALALALFVTVRVNVTTNKLAIELERVTKERDAIARMYVELSDTVNPLEAVP